MKKDYKTLWLYLAKRDKKGVQILAKFLSRELSPTKLDNIKRLTLPISWEYRIFEYIDKNKINWEPWVQTETSFENLKIQLKKRGYTDIPSNGQPMIPIAPILTVNVNNFEAKKSMIRKNTQ
jgi:hypothetical protein